MRELLASYGSSKTHRAVTSSPLYCSRGSPLAEASLKEKWWGLYRRNKSQGIDFIKIQHHL